MFSDFDLHSPSKDSSFFLNSLCTSQMFSDIDLHSPSKDSAFFLNSLTKIIDHFAIKYENHLYYRGF